MKSVSFINCEDDGTDQIVSFALSYGEMEIRSLTLLRTPKFEAMLDEAERGVSVSMGGETVDDFEILSVVRLEANHVTIETRASKFVLDVSRVDPTEISEMKALIELRDETVSAGGLADCGTARLRRDRLREHGRERGRQSRRMRSVRNGQGRRHGVV